LLSSVQLPRPPTSPLFPYTTLFRSAALEGRVRLRVPGARRRLPGARERIRTAVRFPTHRDGPRADVSCAGGGEGGRDRRQLDGRDRKSTRLNSSHVSISYAVFCLKK